MMHSLTQLCILLCPFFCLVLLFMDLGDVKAVETVMMINDHAVEGKRLCDVIASEKGGS